MLRRFLVLAFVALAPLSASAQAILTAGGVGASVTANTEISRLTGTIVTDSLSTWANVGAGQGAFDGTPNQTEALSSAANAHGAAPVGTNYLGKDWGVGQSRRITQIIVTGPNNNSLLRGGGVAVTATFDGSNDGVSWTTLDTFTTSGANAQVITRTSATINTTNAYRFHRVAAPGNGSGGCAVAGFQLFDTE